MDEKLFRKHIAQIKSAAPQSEYSISGPDDPAVSVYIDELKILAMSRQSDVTAIETALKNGDQNPLITLIKQVDRTDQSTHIPSGIREREKLNIVQDPTYSKTSILNNRPNRRRILDKNDQNWER